MLLTFFLGKGSKVSDDDSDYDVESDFDEAAYDSDKDPSWCPGEGVSVFSKRWKKRAPDESIVFFKSTVFFCAATGQHGPLLFLVCTTSKVDTLYGDAAAGAEANQQFRRRRTDEAQEDATEPVDDHVSSSDVCQVLRTETRTIGF